MTMASDMFDWDHFLKPLNNKPDDGDSERFEQIQIHQIGGRRDVRIKRVGILLCDMVKEKLEWQHSASTTEKREQCSELENEMKANVKAEAIYVEQDGSFPDTSGHLLVDVHGSTEEIPMRMVPPQNPSDNRVTFIPPKRRLTSVQHMSTLKFQPATASLDDVANMTAIFLEKEKAESLKSDKDTSSSKWNLGRLGFYIRRNNVNLVDRRETSDINRDDFNEFQSKLIAKSKTIHALYRTGCEFSNESEIDVGTSAMSTPVDGLKLWTLPFAPDITEATVRELLDPMLSKVCSDLNITLKLEAMLKEDTTGLPPARSDYLMMFRNVKVGIVEAKTPTTMKRAAIPQLLMQVLHLQNSHGSKSLTNFGLLTDGYRFVFVLLKETDFTFENASGVVRKPLIKIHFAKSWTDLFKIVENLRTIAQLAIDAIVTAEEHNFDNQMSDSDTSDAASDASDAASKPKRFKVL